MKKTHMILLSIVFMLALMIPAANAATNVIRYRAGNNTWNWNAQVIRDSFDVTSAASFSVALPDVDAVFSSYDDQIAITLSIGWTYSTGNSTMTTRGDASEAVTYMIYDYPGV